MNRIFFSNQKIFFISLSLFLLTCLRSQAQWSQLNGPEGGSISDLLLDGTDLYAVTANGGVYKSGDGAANWSLVGDDIVGDDANSIVISGLNIVVGSSTGPYLSNNSGADWAYSTSGLISSDVLQLVLDGTDIYAGTPEGVYISSDNGGSWSGLGTSDLSDEVSSVAVDGTDIWAAVSEDAASPGLYMSANSGTNWSEVTNVGFTDAGVNFVYVSGSNLLVQNSSGEGIKYTSDGGTSWNDATGISDIVATISENGGTLYAGTNGGGIYTSTDDGASWSQFSTSGLDNDLVSRLLFDGTTWYAGTGGGVYKSTDSGSNWTEMVSGMKAHAVSALLTDGSDIYAGTSGGGVYKSSDDGSNWSKVNSGITGKNFLVFSLLKSGSDIYAGTFGGVVKTSDGGSSWTQKNNGLSITFGISSMTATSTNIFAMDLLAAIYTSSDGGDNWTSAIGTGYSGLPFSIGSDGTNIYSSGFFGEVVMISSDAGDNWTASSSGITNSGFNITSQFFYDGSSIYASTAEGMFRSDDNGSSWNNADTGISGQLINDFAMDGSNIYAGSDNGGVFVTSNQGDSWTTANTDLGNLRVGSLAAGSLYAGTTGSSVWSYSPPPVGPPDQPAEVTFSSPTATSVTVNWVEPFDNGSAITGYSLEQKEEGGSYAEVYSGTNTSYAATSLTTGTTYYFRVKATNAEGNSPFSNEADFIPQDVILMADGSTTACSGLFTDSGGLGGNYSNGEDLVFTISPENASDKVEVAFTSVDIEDGWDNLYVYDGPDTGSPLLETITGNSFSGTITSTATNGELTFNFVSDGSETRAGWEAMVSCVSPGASVPDQPAAPTFGTITSSSIVVNWTAPNDNGSTITSYTLEQKEGSGGTFSEIFTGNALTHTATSLDPGTEYFFRVLATNGEGDSPFSNEASETTTSTAPDSPAAPTFGTITETSIVVNWIAPDDNGSAITSYSLEQKEGSGGTYTEIFSGNSLTHTATGLNPETEYFFRVKATNAIGDSPFSNEASETTLMLIPELTYATSIDITTAHYSSFLSVGFDETQPEGLAFNNDGSKLYFVGGVEKTVFEYELDIPFDLNVINNTSEFALSIGGDIPTDVEFNDDGSRMYIVGTVGRTVYQYDLGVPFDVTTASSNGNYSVTAEENQPYGMAFNNDGSKMFVIGTNSVSTGQDEVHEYTLSTNFNVTSAAYSTSFSVITEEDFAQGIVFNGDGRKMFIIGGNQKTVFEYTLGSPFDLSTASPGESLNVTTQQSGDDLAFSSDGTKLFVVGVGNDQISSFDLTKNAFTESASNDGSMNGSMVMRLRNDTFTNAGSSLTSPTHFTIDNLPSGLSTVIQVANDGLTGTLSLQGSATQFDDITDLQFTFTDAAFTNSNAVDVTNATGPASSNLGIDFIEESVSYSTAVDISTALPANVNFALPPTSDIYTDIAFDDTGTHMFVLRRQLGNGYIDLYSLNESYDIASASLETSAFIQANFVEGFSFNENGKKLHILDREGDIEEFRLRIPFDIATIEFISTFDFTSLLSNPDVFTDFSFSNNGKKLFVVGRNTYKVFEFELSTPFVVSTATLTTAFAVDNEETFPTGLKFNGDGTKMILGGHHSQSILAYELTSPFDISSASFTESVSINVDAPYPEGFAFNVQGSSMYIIRTNTANEVVEFSLTENAFSEPQANDGSVEGSLIVSMNNDTFSNAGGTLTSPNFFDIPNLPDGLTPSMDVSADGLTATLTFSGNATSNGPADEVTDLQFTFTDNAFTKSKASDVEDATGPASSNLGIDFLNVPDKPEAPTFGTITPNSIVVNWTAPNDNGSTISGYSLEQKEGSGGTFSEVFSDNALTYTATGLNPETEYFFRVKATNVNGDSPFSDEASISTEAFGPPDAPSPTFDEITSKSVRVTFTGPEGNCGDCTMTYAIDTPIEGTEIIDSPYLASGDVDTGETISLTLGGLTPSTEYSFIVVVFNDFGNTGSGISMVTTADNSNPSISDQSFTIDENTNVDEYVGTLAATDPDGDPLSYSITGGNTDDAFKILNTDDLFVNNNSALDYETTPVFMITVQVDDGYGGTATATITVNLNDIVENLPPEISDQSFSIDENSVAGTTVGTATASDPEGDPLTFTILSGNTGNAFSIDPGTGEVTVNNESELDFEVTEQFILVISVSDGTTSAEANITINLNNIGGSQTITFDPISDKIEGDAAFTLTASASSGFDVTFTIESGPAAIVGNEVTLTGAGMVTIKATQPGDTEFDAAADVEQSFCVNPPQPVISASGLGTANVSLDIGEAYPRRWYLDNTTMFDGTLQTGALSVTQEGTYSVETEVDGCLSTRSSDFTLIITDLSEGLDDILKMYPNPVSDYLNIVAPFDLSEKVDLRIIDANGVILKKTMLKSGWNSLDMQPYSQGLYLLQIEYKNKISNHRIIKN